jgi:thioredoxin reductase
MFDVLIIGGGVSGISCALVLGSAKIKNFAADKEVGVFTHQNHHHYRKLF